MKTEHTAGPWDYDFYDTHVSFYGDDKREDYTFRVEYNKDIEEPEMLANNHIIAAAPDMLSALQMIIDHDGKITGADLAIIHSAIQKATGK